MPARLVIAARQFVRNGVETYAKGDIVSMATQGGVFGTKEVPPDFVRLEVSDANNAEVEQFLFNWSVDFSHTLVTQNASGWRFRLEVGPQYLDASNRSKAVIKGAMLRHINDANATSPWKGCLVDSFTQTEIVVDIPKGGVYQTAQSLTESQYLLALKSDFSDIFRESFRVRRYYFMIADVDFALTQLNGQVTLTKVQALAKIVDKLSE